jgi:hypothetical protein
VSQPRSPRTATLRDNDAANLIERAASLDCMQPRPMQCICMTPHDPSQPDRPTLRSATFSNFRREQVSRSAYNVGWAVSRHFSGDRKEAEAENRPDFLESLLVIFTHSNHQIRKKLLLATTKNQYSTLRDLGFQSRHPFNPEGF